MQVLCWTSDEGVEIRCSDCAQGFALYWGQQTESEKAEALEGMVQALKNHQCIGSGAKTHSAHGFLVPA